MSAQTSCGTADVTCTFEIIFMILKSVVLNEYQNESQLKALFKCSQLFWTGSEQPLTILSLYLFPNESQLFNVG